jgi:hypothetical protein
LSQKEKEKQKQDKWSRFTYFGREIKKVTNVFKDTDIKIAYKTTNTTREHLQLKHHNNNEYDSGV